MQYRYKPQGVCAKEMIFEIDENDIVRDLKVINGCDGNLKGIAELVKGMKVQDIITKLSGIRCNMKNTSCPDQISKALIEFKNRYKLA